MKGIRSYFVLFVLMALALVFHAGSAQATKNIIDKGLDHPTGHYIVEVMKDGRWVEAGRMNADRFYRTLEADLGALVTQGSHAKLRITKSGGNLAHMDSVTLGGAAPTSINTGALDKLARKDNDVMDVTKGVELYFDTAKGTKLALNGRIEGMKIPGMPLMLPKPNQHSEKVTMDSTFYKYTLGSVKPGPFFEDYSHSISGHPMSHTMGWVDTKGQRLVVGIDFTGDNTMDGDADFAKVFVKTASGVKEFKVTEANTKWGKPHFTYTDKVGYQHKVYDFSIPLAELGAKSGDTIEMAFSTYGTWSFGSSSPSLSHSTVSGGFLGSYGYIFNSTDKTVVANIFSPSGAIDGPDIVLQDYSNPYTWEGAHSAYDSVNDRYLVVWKDNSTGEWTMFAQLIGPDGTLIGSRQTISTLTNLSHIHVAYAGGAYMAVWQDSNSGDVIYAQMLDVDGATTGSPFTVSASTYNQYVPEIAGDTLNNRFYVVWYENNPVALQVIGRLFDATGASIGDATVLSTSYPSNNAEAPAVAFSPDHQRYLAAWAGVTNGTTYDISGKLLDKDGVPILSDDILIENNDAAYGAAPAVDYNAFNGSFIVAYADYWGSPSKVNAQYISAADGSATGASFIAGEDSLDLYSPAVAYNSQCLNLMIAAERQNGVYFGTAGTPSPDITLSGTASNIASGSATVTATNFCGATLNITGVTLGGLQPGAFSIINDTCSAAALGVNQSCSVDVTLVGDAGAATLDFASNDPDEPTVSAALIVQSATAPTAPQPQSPANGATGLNPASIVFQWLSSTDADGDIVQYDLFVCTDASFASCPNPVNSVRIASADGGMMVASGLGGLGLVLMGIAFTGGLARRRRIALLLAALALVSVGLMACSGDLGDNVTPTSGPASSSYTVTGLSSGTTYYWKVVAYDGTGNETESAVYSFTTM